jgi:hypothetical protein
MGLINKQKNIPFHLLLYYLGAVLTLILLFLGYNLWAGFVLILTMSSCAAVLLIRKSKEKKRKDYLLLYLLSFIAGCLILVFI